MLLTPSRPSPRHVTGGNASMATDDSKPLVQFGFCHCGCGQKTSINHEQRPARGLYRGQPYRFCKGHHGAKHRRNRTIITIGRVRKLIHVLVAERVLGKPLPPGAQVHHVDGDGKNHQNSNLVICQDQEYHSLLHVRARTLRGGGDPNTQRVCGTCKQAKPFAAFLSKPEDKATGRYSICNVCRYAREVRLKQRKRTQQ